MKENIIIRKAKKGDLNKIAELLLEYDRYENNLDKNIETSSINEIKKENKNYFDLGTEYLLIEKNKKILGVLSVNIDKRGRKKIGVLHTLIVTKEARGDGLGKELVEHAFLHFKNKGCTRARTFVHFKNKNAYNFWNKQGFNFELGYNATKRLKK